MLDEGENSSGFIIFGSTRLGSVRLLYQKTSPQRTIDSAGDRDITRAFVCWIIHSAWCEWIPHHYQWEVDDLPKNGGSHCRQACGKNSELTVLAAHTLSHSPRRGSRSDHNRAVLHLAPGHHHRLGQRLAEVEAHPSYGNLICECELATTQSLACYFTGLCLFLDDIRRDIRLGMGPCQARFCTLRAAGMPASAGRLRRETN